MTASRLVAVEQGAQRRSVANVDLREGIARVAVRRLRNGAQIRRIGKLVDVDHECVGVIEQMPNDGRPDEARTAGHKDRVPTKTHGPS